MALLVIVLVLGFVGVTFWWLTSASKGPVIESPDEATRRAQQRET